MKKTTNIFAITLLVLVASVGKIKAQDSKWAVMTIKTSAVCETCKETIEKALAFEKGVKRSSLNLDTKVVTVTYNPDKTTPEKIRQAIANSGYDADSVKANPKAYQNLPDCCKKENAAH